ncbi:hypothetical protein K493DRAFT_364753 [Basidiobolus meristosporus CBS 931.73]|uniref:Uncharacterized protein n=1 Tax=Basidiobolus meristosporus CBS 931.73 TaxID=1314790 RepID=A0A1Y1VVH2_9FUNG|nr:hypothetical protein K493DRAFT_364753 [Basidiobolus meristosporus CBS 931.73]|eukprot:ORX65005.1 hypothetical protein K493DRAFT_364753 [Basidiobolus meristosporus CBS 931.73]
MGRGRWGRVDGEEDDHLKFIKPSASNNAAIASVSNHGFNPFHNTGHGVLIPNYLINREIELAPEESELKGARFISFEPTGIFATGETGMKYGTTSDEAVEDNPDITADDEDEDEDATDPEEAELWGRFGGCGRWRRGRWGRGRWGRGRWGRRRWGRW